MGFVLLVVRAEKNPDLEEGEGVWTGEIVVVFRGILGDVYLSACEWDADFCSCTYV